jgi:GNAT superfamily N-acetyltransferase
MKNVYDVDWNRARERFGIGPGSQGRAFTTEPNSLSSLMLVHTILIGKPERPRTDVYLRATSEEDAEALLKALEEGREYFFFNDSSYPWWRVIGRTFDGRYFHKQFHYCVTKQEFQPQNICEVIRLDEAHQSLVKAYPDDFSYRQFNKALEQGYPCFGSVVDGKLVSIACTWGCMVFWVHTLEPFRNRGYGKSVHFVHRRLRLTVVSSAISDILNREERATYDVDDGNVASMRICESLGFTKYRETICFEGHPKQS